MIWGDVQFVSDVPGKNDGASGLRGGGRSTNQLIDAVKAAKKSVLIQSPYLSSEGGVEPLHKLSTRASRSISTNLLASTDNIPAFAGFHRSAAICSVRRRDIQFNRIRQSATS
jgi:phosphatidylserine/phosphatidylglycerophosphate/cardiolipin synthase-like enzyme